MRYVVPVNAADEVAALAGAGATSCTGLSGHVVGRALWRSRQHEPPTGARQPLHNGRAGRVVEAAAHGLPIWLALNTRYTEPQLDHLRSCARLRGAWVEPASSLATWDCFGGCARALASRVPLASWRWPRTRPHARGVPLAGGLTCGAASLRGLAGGGCAAWGRAGHGGRVHGLLRQVPVGGRILPAPSWRDVPGPRGCGQHGQCAALHLRHDVPHACLLGSGLHLSRALSLCRLPSGCFEAAGAHIAKLGGRGRPPDERLRALRFLRTAADLGSDEERASLYRSTFGRDCACYYGRAGQDRRAIEPVVVARDASRRYVGSETDFDAFHDAMVRLCQDPPASTAGDLTMLVPPLSESGLRWLLDRLPELSASCPFGTHLAVNDLGTLVEATHAARDRSLGLRVTMGTLLARLDDPAEVAHFLSADENPSRAVWGPAGEPRVLTYREPPEALRRHWATPSLVEPSAQEALRELTGKPSIPYEFG